jgi:hypothetical protein
MMQIIKHYFTVCRCMHMTMKSAEEITPVVVVVLLMGEEGGRGGQPSWWV